MYTDYIRKQLAIKILPDLKSHINEIFHIETDRLDLFYCYHDNLFNFLAETEKRRYKEPYDLVKIVSCVAYKKGTEEYIGYVEFRGNDFNDNKVNETRKQIIELINPYMDKAVSERCLDLYNPIDINIPWMFLVHSEYQKDNNDMRGKGYMKEILLNIIPELREKYYKGNNIYSGSSLSDNAISFFEKLKGENIVNISKKNTFGYKYIFNI